MYPRYAKKYIESIAKTFKVLVVTGPRQVGKTTLLKSMMPKNMNYVTLDDEFYRNQAILEPKLFLEEHPAPLFIDEVQYAPQLFSYIKMIVDNSNLNGQYWLTGSQQFHLMKNVSETLAGRVGIVKMNSFSYSEIHKNDNFSVFEPESYKKSSKISASELFEVIFRGGMPRLYEQKNLSRKAFFDSYIDTYITRDVKNLSEIGNEKAFRIFLTSVASRTGEQLNYTSLANDANISVPTAQKWLSILETSGIVYLLTPYMSSELKRLTHIPKIIFMDTGLASYLSGWETARNLQLSSNSGHYLETFIISEIIKTYNSLGKQLNITYYRDKEKNEIDLIIEKNNTLYPFEIKKTASPNENMIKNFDKLKSNRKKIGAGGIICLADELVHLNKKHYVIPISSVINVINMNK